MNLTELINKAKMLAKKNKAYIVGLGAVSLVLGSVYYHGKNKGSLNVELNLQLPDGSTIIRRKLSTK